MKKSLLAIAATAVLSMAAATSAQASDVLIGSCIYKFDDTFMTGVRNNMEKAAADVGVRRDYSRRSVHPAARAGGHFPIVGFA